MPWAEHWEERPASSLYPGQTNATLLASGQIDAIAVGPNGTIYATGVPTGVQTNFTNPDTMHKLLYANQKESVPVTLTNGSDEPVKGKVTFYLSTNQDQDVTGDKKLTTKGDPSVTVPAGGTEQLAPGVIGPRRRYSRRHPARHLLPESRVHP